MNETTTENPLSVPHYAHSGAECMNVHIHSKCKYKSIQSIANKHLGIYLFIRMKQDNVPPEMYLSSIYSVFSAKDSLSHLIVIFNGCCFPILVLQQISPFH